MFFHWPLHLLPKLPCLSQKALSTPSLQLYCIHFFQLSICFYLQTLAFLPWPCNWQEPSLLCVSTTDRQSRLERLILSFLAGILLSVLCQIYLEDFCAGNSKNLYKPINSLVALFTVCIYISSWPWSYKPS